LAASTLTHVLLHLDAMLHAFVVILLPPPPSTLFPYTTLFRSADLDHAGLVGAEGGLDLAVEFALGLGAARLAAADEFADLHVVRSEEHTSELQSRENLVCRLLLEKKKKRDANAQKRGAPTATD